MADLKLKFVSFTISYLKTHEGMSDVNSVLKCKILSYHEKLDSVYDYDLVCVIFHCNDLQSLIARQTL